MSEQLDQFISTPQIWVKGFPKLRRGLTADLLDRMFEENPRANSVCDLEHL